MKLSVKTFLVFVTLVSCSFIAFSLEAERQPKEDIQPLILSEWLPMEVGTTWEYEITKGEPHPTIHYDIVYKDKNNSRQEVQIDSLLIEPDKNPAKIILRVTRKFQVSDPVSEKKYPAVEIKAVSDETTILANTTRIFWVPFDDGNAILEMQYLDPQKLLASELRSAREAGLTEVISRKVIFMFKNPGEGFGVGDGSEAEGSSFVTRFVAEKSLEFIRTYKDPPDSLFTGLGFEEITKFEKGKGMVSLTQTKAGKTAFSWKLTRFTPGQE